MQNDDRTMLNDIRNDQVCHLVLDCKTVGFSLKNDGACEPNTPVSPQISLNQSHTLILAFAPRAFEKTRIYYSLLSLLN